LVINENEIVSKLIVEKPTEVLEAWLREVNNGAGVTGRASASAQEARELLQALSAGLGAGGNAANFTQAIWDELREVLAKLSRSGASRGDSAGDTSRFVLAMKRPFFAEVQRALANDPSRMATELWAISWLVDQMAQHTSTVFQHSREQVVQRQQQDLLELSTPVVRLWDGVLAVPMIGALDSARTQLMMESLLQRIVDTGSQIAIMDITGVPTVDTLVAQHLVKTATAIRLMGADCIISGVRPQIAQTIVHLGIDLQGITTKASLADALALAMKRIGYVVTRTD
jgi:rsbT co-antagonist protein RsbR